MSISSLTKPRFLGVEMHQINMYLQYRIGYFFKWGLTLELLYTFCIMVGSCQFPIHLLGRSI